MQRTELESGGRRKRYGFFDRRDAGPYNVQTDVRWKSLLQREKGDRDSGG